jgi:hypothetical protein
VFRRSTTGRLELIGSGKRVKDSSRRCRIIGESGCFDTVM